MWQGVQRAFVNQVNQPCAGGIPITVGDRAVCYADPSGTLKCAGAIYDQIFGGAFTPVAGVSGVQQILISPTANAPDHNSVCVRTADGTAWCMGGANDHGEFGNGATGPSAGWVQWGSFTNVVALATGTWDQICGVMADGLASCSGYAFSTTPSPVGSSATTLWVDTFGMAHVDDPTILRAVNGRTDCQVTAAGLQCVMGTFGTAGDVVDGTYCMDACGDPASPPGQSRYCWLTGEGTVLCQPWDMLMMGPLGSAYPMFVQQKVLALAGNPYTSSLCAVYADGSIACMGRNDQGQLGLPAQDYVPVETIVQPPGSVDVSCQ
jgi:hypothetical protein